jgi:hypothetical protein
MKTSLIFLLIAVIAVTFPASYAQEGSENDNQDQEFGSDGENLFEGSFGQDGEEGLDSEEGPDNDDGEENEESKRSLMRSIVKRAKHLVK